MGKLLLTLSQLNQHHKIQTRLEIFMTKEFYCPARWVKCNPMNWLAFLIGRWFLTQEDNCPIKIYPTISFSLHSKIRISNFSRVLIEMNGRLKPNSRCKSQNHFIKNLIVMGHTWRWEILGKGWMVYPWQIFGNNIIPIP
jgi:hypothetical protein